MTDAEAGELVDKYFGKRFCVYFADGWCSPVKRLTGVVTAMRPKLGYAHFYPDNWEPEHFRDSSYKGINVPLRNLIPLKKKVRQ